MRILRTLTRDLLLTTLSEGWYPWVVRLPVHDPQPFASVARRSLPGKIGDGRYPLRAVDRSGRLRESLP